MKDGNLWLGHDEPRYLVAEEWLKDHWYRLLVHCKDVQTLMLLKGFHCFAHDDDPFVLTRDGKIWLHDLSIVPDHRCIVPLITQEQVRSYPHKGMYGVVSDYPVECRSRFA